ncbi:NAD-dependent epimerase/dehydratase [Listeria fleischmannii subsp. fleischmannii LU2006-1]|nr:NAD-dependent epimerase/dehydratase [Listeria fleischmannii subsp. fleischmannii LU2006-1]
MEEQILVTGGTGFMAMHLIIQLLEKGYSVKTTVRSLASKEKVLKNFKRQRRNSNRKINVCGSRFN